VIYGRTEAGKMDKAEAAWERQFAWRHEGQGNNG
jgi:hypothetical protein